MTLSGSPLSDELALGLFEDQTDVGSVSRPGSCTYDGAQQAYTIEGAGANIWHDHDDFHYVWKRMTGDFILSMRANFTSTGVDPHRKLGWMVRASLATISANVHAGVHGDGLTSLQFRRAAKASTEEVRFSVTGPDVIQLERKSSTSCR